MFPSLIKHLMSLDIVFSCFKNQVCFLLKRAMGTKLSLSYNIYRLTLSWYIFTIWNIKILKQPRNESLLILTQEKGPRSE